jgi:hypothetical protein
VRRRARSLALFLDISFLFHQLIFVSLPLESHVRDLTWEEERGSEQGRRRI